MPSSRSLVGDFWPEALKLTDAYLHLSAVDRAIDLHRDLLVLPATILGS